MTRGGREQEGSGGKEIRTCQEFKEKKSKRNGGMRRKRKEGEGLLKQEERNGGLREKSQEGREKGGLSRDKRVKEEEEKEEEGRRRGRKGRERRDGRRRSVGLEGQIMEQLISW